MVAAPGFCGLGRDRAKKIGEFPTPALNVEQKELVAVDQPGRPDRIIMPVAELGGGVPALDDLAGRFALRGLGLSSKPGAFEQVAIGRDRSLLVLRLEDAAADRPADLVEGLQAFTIRTQCGTRAPVKDRCVTEWEASILRGDRWQRDDLKTAFLGQS
jgi:hypothetical protein